MRTESVSMEGCMRRCREMCKQAARETTTAHVLAAAHSDRRFIHPSEDVRQSTILPICLSADYRAQLQKTTQRLSECLLTIERTGGPSRSRAQLQFVHCTTPAVI